MKQEIALTRAAPNELVTAPIAAAAAVTSLDIETEKSLLLIRNELKLLHQRSPFTLPQPTLSALLTLLPTSYIQPTPRTTAQTIITAYSTTESAFLSFRRFIGRTIIRLFWIGVVLLTCIGGTTVLIALGVYSLAKLVPWDFGSEGFTFGNADGFQGQWPTRTAESVMRETVRMEIDR